MAVNPLVLRSRHRTTQTLLARSCDQSGSRVWRPPLVRSNLPGVGKWSDVNPSFAALADPTRRAICQRLAHGRATVGQLAALFPMSRPAVSQHLRVLREAGLIQPESGNRLSAYELVPGPLLDVEAWAHRVVTVWERAAQYRFTAQGAESGKAMT